MKLIGEHNVVAARLAYEVATQCGLEDAEIRKAIATFSAVEGRLEDLGLFGDKRVRVFNDNNATTPEATIAALTAIKETYHKNPILIIGGADKGLPLEMLVETVKNTTKACVFLEGTGTARLEMLQGKRFATLSACVEEAFLLAEDDDIILFSPAFASFSNEFNNEYEKNDAFIKKVESFT